MMKLRMARGGAKKKPFYHIVAADSHSPRDGRFVEKLGTFNPCLPKDHEERVRLNVERIKYWLEQGAQPSDRVAYLLGTAGIIDMPARKERPQKSQPKAKMTERRKEKEEKAAAAKEAAEAPAEAPAEEAPAEEAPAEEAAAEETKAE